MGGRHYGQVARADAANRAARAVLARAAIQARCARGVHAPVKVPAGHVLDLADRSLLPGAQYCWHCKAPLDVDEDDEGSPFEPTWDPGDYTPGGPGPLNAILDHVIARLEGVPL